MILIEQVEHFGDDLKYAVKHKSWPPNSKLTSLAPFIGPRGELRVGGRLKLLNLPELTNVQIIVPKSHMAVLLVHDLHKHMGHSQGRDRLIAEARQVYWI
jgi:hypothetical protein